MKVQVAFAKGDVVMFTPDACPFCVLSANGTRRAELIVHDVKTYGGGNVQYMLKSKQASKESISETWVHQRCLCKSALGHIGHNNMPCESCGQMMKEAAAAVAATA